jgi:hypothetical protein
MRSDRETLYHTTLQSIHVVASIERSASRFRQDVLGVFRGSKAQHALPEEQSSFPAKEERKGINQLYQ